MCGRSILSVGKLTQSIPKVTARFLMSRSLPGFSQNLITDAMYDLNNPKYKGRWDDHEII